MGDILIRLANTISAVVGQILRPVADLVRFLPDRLRARWFGSDVLVGSTTNYTWTANQLGHFTIGLALYMLVRQVLTWITFHSLETGSAGVIILGILAVVLTVLLYAVKETADFRLAIVPGRQFAIEDQELRLDGFADSFFVGFGAAFLFTATWSWIAWLIVLVGFGAIAFMLAMFYLPRADRFDFSNLPNYYRLELFPGRVESLDETVPDKTARATELIAAVSRNMSDQKALLVLGAPGTGRTSLLLGIGTRLAVANVKLRFIQAGKLNGDFSEELAKQKDENQELAYNFDLWALRDVTHVIIDDALANGPEAYLAGLTPEVREFLSERTLVIVIAGGSGLEQQARETARNWESALQSSLKFEQKVEAVLSTQKLDPRQRNTALMQS